MMGFNFGKLFGGSTGDILSSILEGVIDHSALGKIFEGVLKMFSQDDKLKAAQIQEVVQLDVPGDARKTFTTKSGKVFRVVTLGVQRVK